MDEPTNWKTKATTLNLQNVKYLMVNETVNYNPIWVLISWVKILTLINKEKKADLAYMM